MTKLTAAIVLALTASTATAQVAIAADDKTITIASADGVKVVRWLQERDNTVVEIIAADEDINLQCIALDAAGEPLAASTTIGALGKARFDELDASTVADVICREG